MHYTFIILDFFNFDIWFYFTIQFYTFKSKEINIEINGSFDEIKFIIEGDQDMG